MGNKKVNRIMSNNKSSARPNYNNYHVLTIYWLCNIKEQKCAWIICVPLWKVFHNYIKSYRLCVIHQRNGVGVI